MYDLRTYQHYAYFCYNNIYKAAEIGSVDGVTSFQSHAFREDASFYGKIRVAFSSDSGIYVPHANIKGHWAEVTETKTANNTVYLKDSFIALSAQ